ncbi:family 20 glycosylhydrolase [Amycolatopsis sp. H20-H5]|uniref:family 20 glycosylhydrolase n=1 Tax=Amycolatopsis sp. H20-H5 TaxID=3046309 RepID=UPI002DB993A9|nr:family 20 glycosylhydrolase [Amycolatopsis sp. H20-H5]MEC3974111.1 family 20 glycosylhydrolase [Amycolatopsis sp. H20-H5]
MPGYWEDSPSYGWRHCSRPPVSAASPPIPFSSVVPVATPVSGVTYTLAAGVGIADTGVTGVGDYLAAILRRSTGYTIPVHAPGTGAAGIALLLSGAPPSAGEQGYQLDITASGVTIRALKAAGLFAGVQTLLRLLPPGTVSGGQIVDHPSFGFRSAMLDVARHFFTVDQVKRYLDQLARYKINTFHLHLADDQGWRIMINGWERMATYGGSTQVGGGAGGYYTQAQYADIVAYAQQRYITVIPEIDLPGHTNAALASYAQLNCDGKAPALYTGTDVGFSTLCTSKEVTYQFLDAVIGQLAALTPGPYLHLGGDEAQSTKPADYETFMNRVQQITASHGKSAIGWHEIVNATPLASTVAQFWDTTTSDSAVAAAAKNGAKIVFSPANHAYLDMKYNSSTTLGQDWAGLTEVRKSYDWNPGAYLSGVPESAVLGVDAPLWTETLRTSADLEYLAFPRLSAIAELGWSPQSTHDWTAFGKRLAAQGPLWKLLGINYYKSSQVPWPAGS